jgi:hypothetical protein
MEKEVKMMPPQKTWFFEDTSGRIFPANEKEAFELMTNNSRWRRQDIKMVGVSDGTTYHKTIEESKQKIADLNETVKEMKQKLNLYIKGHDKLMFEDFLDENDPKVKRAKEVIAKTQKEIDPVEKKLETMRKDIVQIAFEAELEQARGHMENPRDFSVIAKSDGSPRGDEFMKSFAQARRVI